MESRQKRKRTEIFQTKVSATAFPSIAQKWRELSGEGNWKDLLDPLDSDLRPYIIHYGQMTAAAGDLYKGQKKYMGVGPDPYPKEDFFDEACLVKGNKLKYKVTHYIYATFNSPLSEWIGYAAVSTDEAKQILGRRDIFVAWRGTKTWDEWKHDADFPRTSASELFGKHHNATVHEGFFHYYTGTNCKINSARDQVREALKELLNEHRDEEVSITVAGFSLGGALATLNAMDIVYNKYNKLPRAKGNTDEKLCMVTAFTFGGPRVGNDGFKRVFQSLDDNLHLLRLTNKNDPVPKIPFEIFGFHHVESNNLKVDTSNSSNLKWRLLGRYLMQQQQLDLSVFIPTILKETSDMPTEDIIGHLYLSRNEWINSWFHPEDYVSSHNMDVYMHGVAIKDGGKPEDYYDLALVNKHLDRIKDKFGIPHHWWDDPENRAKMEQDDDGHWHVIT